jgi:hypothetical protein
MVGKAIDRRFRLRAPRGKCSLPIFRANKYKFFRRPRLDLRQSQGGLAAGILGIKLQSARPDSLAPNTAHGIEKLWMCCQSDTPTSLLAPMRASAVVTSS